MATKKSNGSNGKRTDGEYDNTDRFVLFKNPRKEKGDQRPDFTGRINIDGTDFWLSAWTQKSQKTGAVFLSGKINDKIDEDQSSKSKSSKGEQKGFGDGKEDMPF